MSTPRNQKSTTLAHKSGAQATVPTPVVQWIGNLVYEPKAAYAAAYAAYLHTGLNEPKAPSKNGVEAAWAAKVRTKVSALMKPKAPAKAPKKAAPKKKAAAKK